MNNNSFHLSGMALHKKNVSCQIKYQDYKIDKRVALVLNVMDINYATAFFLG